MTPVASINKELVDDHTSFIPIIVTPTHVNQEQRTTNLPPTPVVLSDVPLIESHSLSSPVTPK